MSVTLTISQAALQSRRAHWFGYAIRHCDLVAFEEVADWLAREPGSLERNEKRRALALADLRDAVVRGEFGTHGPRAKPHVAYIPKPPPTDRIGHLPLRLTAGQIAAMHDWYGIEIAVDLWAPRALVEQWLATRELAAPPWLKRADPPSEPATEPAAALPNRSLSGIRTISAANAEEECRRWLRARTDSPSTKEAAYEEAIVAVAPIGVLTRKAFERAWHAEAPAAWKGPGRKPRRQ